MTIRTRKAANTDQLFLKRMKLVSMRRLLPEDSGEREDDSPAVEERSNPNEIEIVHHEGRDIGIYELQNREIDWFLARIELLPEYQNQGIRKLILKRVLEHVKPTGRPLHFRILKNHLAQEFHNFVEELGFNKTCETNSHVQLEWNNRRRRRNAQCEVFPWHYVEESR